MIKQFFLRTLPFFMISTVLQASEEKSTMFSMTPSLVYKEHRRGEYYTSIDFQPALIPYQAIFTSSQKKRLLSAIKKYKEQKKHLQNENKTRLQDDAKLDHAKLDHAKLMSLSFYTIENQRHRVLSSNPLLTLYFSSQEELLIFSIERIEQGISLDPEIFYLTADEVDQLEKLLIQEDYVAQK